MNIMSEYVIPVLFIGVFVFGNLFIVLIHSIRKYDEPLRFHHVVLSVVVSLMVLGVGVFIPLSFYLY